MNPDRVSLGDKRKRYGGAPLLYECVDGLYLFYLVTYIREVETIGKLDISVRTAIQIMANHRRKNICAYAYWSTYAWCQNV